MNKLLFDINEGPSPPNQDLSSPEDDTNNSFHTPNHYSANLGSSTCSILASQDSLDIFHDAPSTLQNTCSKIVLPQVPPASKSPVPERPKRRRHFSSGAKLDDVKRSGALEFGDWDDADEHTCMLPKCPIAKIKNLSQARGQGSKSCNGSPFHVPRLSMSTSSLKRKSLDRMSWYSSPQKQPPFNQGGHGAVGSGPYVEVDMIKETDEELKNSREGNLFSTGGPSGPSGNSSQTLPLPNPADGDAEPALNDRISNKPTKNDLGSVWRQNYVPCVDLNSLYEKPIRPVADQVLKVNGTVSKFHFQKRIRRKRKTWEIIKGEFTPSNFRFDHKSPHLFVTSQWQQPNEMCCMYLAYRLFWGVYFTMWGIWSWIGFGGYSSPSRLKWYYLIFLTDWAIWLLAFDTMLQAINVALHIRKIAEEGDARYAKMKSIFKFSWAVSTITSTLHLFITLFFWTTVYPYSKNSVTAISVNTHMMQCFYVVLDSFVSATPRRVFHAYLPMGLITVYGIFTNIYYLAGGTNHYGELVLYPLLDWSEQFKTLLIGSSIVILVIPAIHSLVVCVLYGLRVKLWRSLNYTRYSQDIETVHSVSMEEKV